MSGKDVAETASLEHFFPEADHFLRQFHVIKAVDVRLNYQVDGKGLSEPEKDEIRERFQMAKYADSEDDLNAAKEFFLSLGN